MNVPAPPKQKRAPAKSALRNAELLAAYHTAQFLAKLIGAPFWFVEQWRTHLQDRIDNRESDR
jgi:hypothetical protein